MLPWSVPLAKLDGLVLIGDVWTRRRRDTRTEKSSDERGGLQSHLDALRCTRKWLPGSSYLKRYIVGRFPSRDAYRAA
jgi:hypothetical protein